MTKKEKTYSIGLDIGSTSVGWSVIDEDYNLLKFKGKNMWGSRLFEEGKTAVNRRMARTTRRRLQRRNERIALLKSLIGKMVLDKDIDFFMRMEKGCLTKEDKNYDFNLFIEEMYNDIDFYKQFKTIYHVRKYLYTTQEKVDPRLIYLALHHIIKYRGNFLYEGLKFEVSKNSEIKEKLIKALTNIFSDSLECKNQINELGSTIFSILIDENLNKGSKKEEIVRMFVEVEKDCKKKITETVNLLLGYESNLTKLFENRNIQKDDKDFKTNFSSIKYEDDIDFIELSLQEDFETITELQSVYSYSVLQDILNGHELICDAMIESYNKHHEDLTNLKTNIKEYGNLDIYNKIFRDKKTRGNYYSYIEEPGKTSKIELYAFLKKLLGAEENIANTEFYKTMVIDMEKDNFLPKQTTKENGAIPYQMHEQELIKILDNQGKYYPELLSEKHKILSLFKFRIPYYVGPLNTHSEHAWIIRNNSEKITPWNFEEEVDLLQSAEFFIRRMTNCCTYLLTEPVVPKKSLLYTKYEVLNELNKIRVNGKLLDCDIKKMIFSEVFLMKKKVNKKDIEAFYSRKQLSDINGTFEIKGFQKEDEFASSLDSWIDFIDIFKDEFENSIDKIETLIEWISVYEDKKILKKRIENEFPDIANDKVKMKKIIKLRYKGWGRLSKKLLVDMRVKDKSDNYVSIMDCLENTNMNFMQIINDKDIDFKHVIENFGFQDENIQSIKYEQISLLQGSPAIKKAIWQTVKIVEEIVEIMNCNPKQIYIEFARNDDEKKRTQNKVKRLQDIYSLQSRDGCKDADFITAFKELSKLDNKTKLDNDRLTLYFIQQGKCMYSGKPLDISKLHLYQVDHILPQSFIKDDSVENKALVISNENQNKGDKMLLSSDIIKRQFTWWKYLLDSNLIGEKKFKNITRNYFSEKDEMGFINRQLVETRQIIKHVANLFKVIYEGTNIVSIKANLSSSFRQKFELYKVREINDYHHAQDAYLASIIGTFVLKKYPILRKEFIFTEYNQINNYKQDLKYMNQTKAKFGFVLNAMKNERVIDDLTGEVIWDGANTIMKIKKAFNYKDCFITKKPEERKGQLFNLTIKKNEDILKKELHKIIPLNKQRTDVQKYGGYTSLEKAYGIAVSYKIKNKEKREVLDVPRVLANDKKSKILEYLMHETGSEEVVIIKDKILYNQLFECDGGFYTMASASEWNNAKQLFLSPASQKTLYFLFDNKFQNPSDEDILKVYDEYLDKISKYYPIYVNLKEKLLSNREKFIALEDKKSIMKNLLKVTKANPENGNLMDGNFEISSRAGRIATKSIDLSKTTFIHQSVTGLFEKKYKL